MIMETIPLNILDEMAILEPIITVFILIFMMALMIYFFVKKQVWVVSLAILMFSIMIWVGSLAINLPLAPYFQNFFILFQSLIFAVISYKTTKYKGRKK